jgi:hypothetical protein
MVIQPNAIEVTMVTAEPGSKTNASNGSAPAAKVGKLTVKRVPKCLRY